MFWSKYNSCLDDVHRQCFSNPGRVMFFYCTEYTKILNPALVARNSYVQYTVSNAFDFKNTHYFSVKWRGIMGTDIITFKQPPQLMKI